MTSNLHDYEIYDDKPNKQYIVFGYPITYEQLANNDLGQLPSRFIVPFHNWLEKNKGQQ